MLQLPASFWDPCLQTPCPVFTWVLRIQTQVLVFAERVFLSTEPSSQPFCVPYTTSDEFSDLLLRTYFSVSMWKIISTACAILDEWVLSAFVVLWLVWLKWEELCHYYLLMHLFSLADFKVIALFLVLYNVIMLCLDVVFCVYLVFCSVIFWTCGLEVSFSVFLAIISSKNYHYFSTCIMIIKKMW